MCAVQLSAINQGCQQHAGLAEELQANWAALTQRVCHEHGFCRTVCVCVGGGCIMTLPSVKLSDERKFI